MSVFAIEVSPQKPGATEQAIAARLRAAGLAGVKRLEITRLFLIEGDLGEVDAERIARDVLADPVSEQLSIRTTALTLPPNRTAFEVFPRPGVMDPVAESTLTELRAEGFAVTAVRTGTRYVLEPIVSGDLTAAAYRGVANDCIEEVHVPTFGVKLAPRPPQRPFELRSVRLRGLSENELTSLSRTGHLFLSLDEMRAVQRHFEQLGRDPTDLELETLAQTWSEHCVHKTLKSAVRYRGAALPGSGVEAREYANLLKETIVRATEEITARGVGPKCLSVFKDNAGIIDFDEQTAVAFKVETHNHPSAIEPYGGAATGVGGCIRDVMGCGRGAQPIANTDVFCVAPGDWRDEDLPAGVLHPARILRDVVRGVADYGNRMGIPTVNGAVCFDPRYLGNPLVFCGCIGLIPKSLIEKRVSPGDKIVLVGGRTGRDGIHGATFSSAELTDTHADEFSHAVQIGNAITEKRVLDALLKARDHAGGCLYSAITDCGAGGLSSAVGEMAEKTGAVVDLEKVPLKYSGLRYDEIWISEAQERMVFAVPPANLPAFLDAMRAEEAEATVIGEFGHGERGTELEVRFEGKTVGRLDMAFLHDGLPKRTLEANWSPRSKSNPARKTGDRSDALVQLRDGLRSPNASSREWIIRQYDHEVQGRTVIKPLIGRGNGPADAAVLNIGRGTRGIAIGCGIAPHLSDIDPYWMAANAIDEAIRNVVCVGGDPRQTAILDNFCWGRVDDPRQLGALVRACQACYDVATAFGTPFISGKDSLNNEFALDPRDVERMIAALQRVPTTDERIARTIAAAVEHIRATQRIGIPPTLLISAVAIVGDIRKCVTSDLKQPGGEICLVGGMPVTDFAFDAAARVHHAVADAIQRGLVRACHDASENGWLPALAEMCIGGVRGAEIAADAPLDGVFDQHAAAYVVETGSGDPLREFLVERGVSFVRVGTTSEKAAMIAADARVELTDLTAIWRA